MKAQKQASALNRRIRKKRNGMQAMQLNAFMWIIIPYAVFTILLKAFPIIWGLFISFTNYNGNNLGNLKLVGIQNYARVFIDNEAFSSMGRTALITAIVVPLMVVISLMLSLLLNNAIRGIGIYRTIFYLPSIIPGVAVAMMWSSMYTKSGGFMNAVREFFGLSAVNWFDFTHARTALIIMLLWGAGSSVLTKIAAIKCIPDELYEAADLDGIGFIRKTMHITIPLISNMIYLSFVTGIITMLQLFAQPVLLTGTGTLTSIPIKPIYTYVVHVYQQLFVNMRFGYGLAMVWVIFVFIIAITLILERTSKYWVYNEVENKG